MNTFRHSEHSSTPVQDVDLQQKSTDTVTDSAADAPAAANPPTATTATTAAGSFAPIRDAMRDPVGYMSTHRYALWLLYLPAYLLYFGMLQLRAVPAEAVHIIETPLDRMIPTIPAFFVPYAIWWLLFPSALVFFLFYGTRRDFLKLCFILFGGYTICMVVYTVWPNGLALREPLTGSDLFSLGVQWLRSIDPPRNVCPSMHVSSTIAIDLVVRQCSYIRPRTKNLETIIAVLICVATLFIRQHSIIDVVLGFAMSWALYFVWKWAVEPRISEK